MEGIEVSQDSCLVDTNCYKKTSLSSWHQNNEPRRHEKSDSYKNDEKGSLHKEKIRRVLEGRIML